MVQRTKALQKKIDEIQDASDSEEFKKKFDGWEHA